MAVASKKKQQLGFHTEKSIWMKFATENKKSEIHKIHGNHVVEEVCAPKRNGTVSRNVSCPKMTYHGVFRSHLADVVTVTWRSGTVQMTSMKLIQKWQSG